MKVMKEKIIVRDSSSGEEMTTLTLLSDDGVWVDDEGNQWDFLKLTILRSMGYEFIYDE